jgi:hypothetical protein
MRTYSQSETDLAFQWVDKYFKLVELILEISDDEEGDIPLSAPSSESEQKFQELRRWFFAHQDKFMTIWSEFWRNKISTRYFEDNGDGQGYFKNPFLMLYKPSNLCELVYRLGISENFDTRELTEQGAEVIEDITVDFSLEVIQFIHYVGEFAEDNDNDRLTDTISAHFVGSIVYVEKGLYQVTSQSPLLVIDGQQRLTTISLLIEALARILGESEPIDGFSAKKLRNYFLLNPLEEGERKYKLVLSQTDKASLVALLEQQAKPREHSIRVESNFNFFYDHLVEVKDDIKSVCKGLAKLVIVDISLNRDQDNPQLIFSGSCSRELRLRKYQGV